jgi:hypothetical protein
VTFSAAPARSAIEVYRLVTTTIAPADGENNVASPATSVTDSIDIPSDGVGIAFVCNNGSADSTDVTFTNATADAGSLFVALGSSSIGKSALVNGTGTVSVNGTVNGAANLMTISLAAWGP